MMTELHINYHLMFGQSCHHMMCIDNKVRISYRVPPTTCVTKRYNKRALKFRPSCQAAAYSLFREKEAVKLFLLFQRGFHIYAACVEEDECLFASRADIKGLSTRICKLSKNVIFSFILGRLIKIKLSAAC